MHQVKYMVVGVRQDLIMMVIYYIYLTTKNKIIYKTTTNDNYLEVGQYNQYGHKLIYKASILTNKICEYKDLNGSDNLWMKQ